VLAILHGALAIAPAVLASKIERPASTTVMRRPGRSSESLCASIAEGDAAADDQDVSFVYRPIRPQPRERKARREPFVSSHEDTKTRSIGFSSCLRAFVANQRCASGAGFRVVIAIGLHTSRLIIAL